MLGERKQSENQYELPIRINKSCASHDMRRAVHSDANLCMLVTNMRKRHMCWLFRAAISCDQHTTAAFAYTLLDRMIGCTMNPARSHPDKLELICCYCEARL